MMNNKEEGLELDLSFEKRGGILPVVVQEKSSGKVLMVAYANREAVEKTLSSRKATFFSTSRETLWTKGETSGDYLSVLDVLVDCDQDALIFQVELMGDGVCHTWQDSEHHRKSCFYRKIELGSSGIDGINPTLKYI